MACLHHHCCCLVRKTCGMYQKQCRGTAIWMSADVYYFSKTLMVSVRFSCHVSRVCVAIFVRVSMDVVVALM